jgi:hypothetical protein
MADLQKLFQDITGQWNSSIKQIFSGHPLANKFRNEFVEAIQSIVKEAGKSFEVKGSVGAGNWASVPWLSIFDSEITRSAQDGIYPVYLFKADASGFYLWRLQELSATRLLN